MSNCTVKPTQFRRIDAGARQCVELTFNGQALQALEGDTVLTALLLHKKHCRQFEFAAEKRAGFCLMGACQDCWVCRTDGTPVRACTTLVEAEMALQEQGQDYG